MGLPHSFARYVLLAGAFTPIASAHSCTSLPDLCSRLNPDMVAFIGRPISSSMGPDWADVNFAVQERLWGPVKAGMVNVGWAL